MANVSNISTRLGKKTFFGDVLSAFAASENLKLREVAQSLGCSPSTLSMVGKGERKLNDSMALGLADLFGSHPKFWGRTFEATQHGSDMPIEYFRSELLQNMSFQPDVGVRIRRLRQEDILSCLSTATESDPFRIDDFEENRVQPTSYDTIIDKLDNGEGEIQKRDDVTDFLIPAGASLLATTLEAITLPSWMEADIHPASNLAKKHLIVSNGPIIDPGYDNFLTVAVFNPTNREIFIEKDEPFMTLRFWIQDTDGFLDR